MSDSVSLHDGHSSDILNQQTSENATFLHGLLHDGNHQYSRDGQTDNLKYHSFRDNPFLHRTYSSQPDQSFDESVPHGTYVLPTSRGQREERIDGQNDSRKYQHSKSNDLVAHYRFTPNPRDQPFDEITPLGPHVNRGSSPEENRDPSDPPVPNHNGFTSIRHNYPFDKSDSITDYETEKGDLKYYSQKTYPFEPNHKGFTSNHHDHPLDRRASKADYETQQEDLKYHSDPNADLYSGTPSNNDDQPSDMSTSFRATFRHPISEETHHKDPPEAYNSGISSNFPNQSYEKSAFRENNANSIHGGSHELVRNREQDSFKYQNSKSNPSLEQNRFPTNPRDQSFDGSTYRSTYVHPSHGNHKVTRDGQRNSTYHSVQNHNDFLSNPNNNPLDESGSMANYKAHKRDKQFHSPTVNPNVAFDSGISTNNHDQPYDINTSSHATFPNPYYRETHGKDHTDTPRDSKYHSPKNSPSIVFPSGYSSKTHVQSSDHQRNLFYPPQRESHRETHSANEEDLRYTNRPSSSYVNHHNGFPSKTTDQSSHESVIRTVVIQPPYKKNNWENRDVHQEDLRKINTPLTVVPDRHQSNAQVNPVQSNHRPIQAQQSFGQNTKTPHDFGNTNPSISPPNVLHNSYMERIHDDTGSKDIHQYNQGQLSYEDSHQESHDKQLEQLRYQDLNEFQVQKDRFPIEPVGIQDNTIYHRSDTSSKYVLEHPEQNREYEPHVPFHDHTTLHQTEQDIDVSKHHNTQSAKNRHFTKNQQSESHNSQDVAEHNENFRAHHKYSGYVPFSAPYTRPQVMNDLPNNNEIASVTVKPFQTPKAQSPRGLQLSSFLNSQPPTGHPKPDTRHVQTHSLPEVQQRENQKDHQNYGFPENRYSLLSPLYNDYIEARQSQRERPNTNQNDHFSLTPRSQTNAGYIRRGSSGDHYSSQKNMIPETHSKISNSYSMPDTEHKQVNLHANALLKSTRNEEMQTNPLYPYEGEYVNYAGSKNNAYKTERHHV